MGTACSSHRHCAADGGTPPPLNNTPPYVCYVMQISAPPPLLSVSGCAHPAQTDVSASRRGPEVERKRLLLDGGSCAALECLEKSGKLI